MYLLSIECLFHVLVPRGTHTWSILGHKHVMYRICLIFQKHQHAHKTQSLTEFSSVRYSALHEQRRDGVDKLDPRSDGGVAAGKACNHPIRLCARRFSLCCARVFARAVAVLKISTNRVHAWTWTVAWCWILRCRRHRHEHTRLVFCELLRVCCDEGIMTLASRTTACACAARFLLRRVVNAKKVTSVGEP